MLLGRALCCLMQQLQPKIGNHFVIFCLFLSVLLISCLPNVSNKTYHSTIENHLSSEHMALLVSITLCQLVYQIQPKQGEILGNFCLSILIRFCLPYVSKKLHYGKGEDQFSTQHKIRTFECFLGEHFVSSWSSHGLRRGIPWFFLYVSLCFIDIISS